MRHAAVAETISATTRANVFAYLAAISTAHFAHP
jgi:hypothetical protein